MSSACGRPGNRRCGDGLGADSMAMDELPDFQAELQL